jgi:hypothetical protein
MSFAFIVRSPPERSSSLPSEGPVPTWGKASDCNRLLLVRDRGVSLALLRMCHPFVGPWIAGACISGADRREAFTPGWGLARAAEHAHARACISGET